MRYVTTIALILLPCAGLAALFYYYGVWGPIVPFALVFFERVLWRLLFRAMWFLVFLNLLPKRTRHKYEDLVRGAKQKCERSLQHAEVVWKDSTWPVRVLLAIAGAVVSGVCSFALLVLPVHVVRLPFGGWLRDTGLPFLMRSATAKSLEANLPEGWQHLPKKIRRTLTPWYMHLWWWTARRLVRTRQALGKRTRRRLKRKGLI